jgi:hypothetical protein
VSILKRQVLQTATEQGRWRPYRETAANELITDVPRLVGSVMYVDAM